MSERHPSEFPLEPERYELLGSVPPSFDLDRRAFFRLAGAGHGGGHPPGARDKHAVLGR